MSLTVGVLLSSCRSTKTVSDCRSRSDCTTERTDRQENIVVYVTDSVIVERTDTLVKERQRRDRLIEHTVWRTDTIEVERIVEQQVVQERQVVPRWCWIVLTIAIAATTVCIIRLLIWLRRL